MKFLYCIMTELWGHRQRVRAGNGKAGASEVADMEEKPHVNVKT